MLFLASNGYRAIAHDRRGHGRSEVWQTEREKVEQHRKS
jgi:alpha-beta hydrolase superfamily lysophospholipase